jgi:hypothetical protein
LPVVARPLSISGLLRFFVRLTFIADFALRPAVSEHALMRIPGLPAAAMPCRAFSAEETRGVHQAAGVGREGLIVSPVAECAVANVDLVGKIPPT